MIRSGGRSAGFVTFFSQAKKVDCGQAINSNVVKDGINISLELLNSFPNPRRPISFYNETFLLLNLK